MIPTGFRDKNGKDILKEEVEPWPELTGEK